MNTSSININNREYPMSLNYLGNLSGTVPSNSPDANLYGALFIPVDRPAPAGEIMLHATVDPRWLGQKYEGTFMNRTKARNEPPVKTYQDLQMFPIPQDNYESTLNMRAESVPYAEIKKPPIRNLLYKIPKTGNQSCVEHFDCQTMNNPIYKTISFIIVILILFFLFYKIN